MARTPITELDFDKIKRQLKTYLKGQDRFKDYDFEGSNMSVLLDVLAYNTYQNNFYTNMAISEMFLDSAILENSVASHTKELNYLPRSSKSAKAVVSLTINDPNETASTLVVPRYTKFSARSNTTGVGYNFYTDQTYIASKQPNGNYFVDCVEIFEGELADEAFFISSPEEVVELTNEDIDTSSIRVVTNFEEPTEQEEYFFREGVYGVEATDPVFYLQAGLNNTYEIYFGRDVYGKTPSFNEEVRVFYRISSGEDANGSTNFLTNFRPNVFVQTSSPADGGKPRESINDIKYFAPRSIQIQERAVTRRDYETLLKQRFNDILDVSAFDGEELDPPQHGKTAIAVNVDGGISESSKNAFLNFLSNKTPLAIQPVFIDSDYMYVDMDVTIYVDENTRTQTNDEIKSTIQDLIVQFNLDNLEKFASTFQISRLTREIDETYDFVLSNTISTEPYIEYNPALGLSENPRFNFGTELIVPYPFSQSEGFTNYKPSIKSTNFIYDGTNCFFQDDGKGNVQLISADIANIQIIKPTIGSVDYETGVVKLSNFLTTDYTGNAIKIFANTVNRNITSPKNRILRLRTDDVRFHIIGKR